MENQDTRNDDIEFIEYIYLNSDKEESEIISNDNRNSLNSLADESDPEELTKNYSFGSSIISIGDSWTKREILRLIFIVNKVNRCWKMIARKYKRYFKNKSARILSKKYFELKKNKSLFQNLEEKSKQVKDVKILEYYKSTIDRSTLTRWSENEIIYLIGGAAKYDQNFEDLFKNYRNRFHESRTLGSLKSKYNLLIKTPRKILYFQQKASLMLNYK